MARGLLRFEIDDSDAAVDRPGAPGRGGRPAAAAGYLWSSQAPMAKRRSTVNGLRRDRGHADVRSIETIGSRSIE